MGCRRRSTLAMETWLELRCFSIELQIPLERTALLIFAGDYISGMDRRPLGHGRRGGLEPGKSHR
ncbi:unnamed protein product, partial [Larinioides sclopetarius]